jgi:hypothetical protein
MPHSDYPVSRFLQRIIQESGLRRSEFIRAIGFANTAKGLRRLDEWLVNGSGDEHFLQRIVDRYHPDPVELQSALQKTEAIHQREYQEALHAMEGRERRRFRPFIWVVSEDGAHSWVMAMAQRQIKLLRFPEEFERLSSIEQLRRNTFAIRLLFPGIGAMNRPVQLAQKRTTMTNLDPAEQPATVAAPPRTVRSKKPSPKKGATQKKGAARAKKTAKSADRKKDAKATTPRNGSKGAKILALIGRPGDATLAAITRATGWQAHPGARIPLRRSKPARAENTWKAAIDSMGRIFSGITLAAWTGDGFPNLATTGFTVPSALDVRTIFLRTGRASATSRASGQRRFRRVLAILRGATSPAVNQTVEKARSGQPGSRRDRNSASSLSR